MKVSKSRNRRLAVVNLLIATTTALLLIATGMPISINVSSHGGNSVLTVNSAAARTPILTTEPGVQPLPNPYIKVTPASIGFGDVEVNSSSSTENVTVTNVGSVDLIIGNLTIDDSQFTIPTGNISGQSLTPNESANITLIFTPTSAGAQSAKLTIPSSDPRT
ncbi:choice-of-anchor D domain-containing protein, partial [Chloroflexota bacterium]